MVNLLPEGVGLYGLFMNRVHPWFFCKKEENGQFLADFPLSWLWKAVSERGAPIINEKCWRLWVHAAEKHLRKANATGKQPEFHQKSGWKKKSMGARGFKMPPRAQRTGRTG